MAIISYDDWKKKQQTSADVNTQSGGIISYDEWKRNSSARQPSTEPTVSVSNRPSGSTRNTNSLFDALDPTFNGNGGLSRTQGLPETKTNYNPIMTMAGRLLLTGSNSDGLASHINMGERTYDWQKTKDMYEAETGDFDYTTIDGSKIKPKLVSFGDDMDLIAKYMTDPAYAEERQTYDEKNEYAKYDLLEDNQKNTFLKLWSEGRKDEAKDYLDSLSRDINRKSTEANKEEFTNMLDMAYDKNVLLGDALAGFSSLAGRAENAVSGILSPATYFASNIANGTNEYIDPNDPMRTGQWMSSIASEKMHKIDTTQTRANIKGMIPNMPEETADKIANSIGTIRNFGIDLVDQRLHQNAPMLFGIDASVMFGFEALADEWWSTADQDRDPLRGFVSGAVKGVETWLTENLLGSEAWFGNDRATKGVQKFSKDWMRATLRAMRGEAFEEVEDQFLGTIIDQLFWGSQSELKQQYDAYIENGLSEEQALEMISTTWFKEMLYSMLVAATSVGMSRSFYEGRGMINTMNLYRGEDARAQAIQEGLASDRSSQAYENAVSLREKGNDVSPWEAYRQAVYNEEAISDERAQAVKEDYKTVFGDSLDDKDADILRRASTGRYVTDSEINRIVRNENLRLMYENYTQQDIDTDKSSRKQRETVKERGWAEADTARDNVFDTRLEENTDILNSLEDKSRAQTVSRQMQSYGKNAFAYAIRNRGDANIDTTTNSFMNYYNAGIQRLSDRHINFSNAVIGESMARQAYLAGRNDSRLNVANYVKTTGYNINSNPGLDRKAAKDTKLTDEDIDELDSFGKMAGLRIELVDSIGSNSGFSTNGKIDTATGTMNVKKGLSANRAIAYSIQQTIAHESLHAVRAKSPKAFNAFVTAAMEYIKSDPKLKAKYNVARWEDAYKELNSSDVLEEMMADFVAQNMSINEMAEMFSRAEPSILQKVHDAMNDAVEKAKKFVGISKEAKEVVDGFGKVKEALRKAISSNSSYRAGDTTRYMVKTDLDGKPYVEIDADILAGVPRRDWVSTVKSYLMSHSIAMGNFEVAVNRTTRREYTNSEYTKHLPRDLYKFKMQMVNNFDEIFREAYGTKNEDAIHNNFESYNRGHIDVTFGGNDYSVEVLTGINKENREIAYDIVNITPTTIRRSVKIKNADDSKRDTRVSHSPQMGVTSAISVPNIAEIADKVNSGQNLTIGEQNVVLEEAPKIVKEARFSRQLEGKAPVERTPKLIAVHNIPDNKLTKAIKLGGFAMPSLAVVLAEQGHYQYGENSFIFPSWMIDPSKSKYAKIYGGDAWTQQINSMVEYKLDSIVVRDTTNRLQKLADSSVDDTQFGGDISNFFSEYGYGYRASEDIDDMVARAQNNYGFMARYLGEKGVKVEKQYREVKPDVRNYDGEILGYLANKFGNEWFDIFGRTAGYLNEEEKAERDRKIKDLTEDWEIFNEFDTDIRPGLKNLKIGSMGRAVYEYLHVKPTQQYDHYRTRDEVSRLVSENGGYEQFKKWVSEQFSEDLIEKAGIYNGKDPFTSIGNRRSFEALHDDLTLFNLVKALRKQQTSKGEGLDTYIAPGSLIAKTTRQYSNLDAVRADENRLGRLSDKEYDGQVVTRLQDQIDLIGDMLMDDVDGGKLDSYDFDEAMNRIALNGVFTNSEVKRQFKRKSYTMADDVASEIVRLMKMAQNVPTGYFEAKIEDAVTFQDMANAGVKALVPQGSKLKKQIEGFGLEVLEYTDEEDRVAKMNGEFASKLRFSKQVDTQKFVKDYVAKNKNKIRYSYAGIKGITAQGDAVRLANYRRALEYDSMGVSNEEIRKATGWFRGSDRQWRFEIDNSKAKILSVKGKKGKMFNVDVKDVNTNYLVNTLKNFPQITVDDVYNIYANDIGSPEKRSAYRAWLTLHNRTQAISEMFTYTAVRQGNATYLEDVFMDEELYAVYPELRKIVVTFDTPSRTPTLGAFTEDGHITLNQKVLSGRIDEGKMKSILLHEIQHWIQEHEDFEEGSNRVSWQSRTARKKGNTAVANNELFDRREAYNNELELNEQSGVDKQSNDLAKKFVQTRQAKVTDVFVGRAKVSLSSEAESIGEELKKIDPSLYTKAKRYIDALAKYEYAVRSGAEDQRLDDFELYQAVAGEQEARDVQARMNYTMDERMANSPKYREATTIFNIGGKYEYLNNEYEGELADFMGKTVSEVEDTTEETTVETEPTNTYGEDEYGQISFGSDTSRTTETEDETDSYEFGMDENGQIRFSRTVKEGEYSLPVIEADWAKIYNSKGMSYQRKIDKVIADNSQAFNQIVDSIDSALRDNYAIRVDYGENGFDIIAPSTRTPLFEQKRKELENRKGKKAVQERERWERRARSPWQVSKFRMDRSGERIEPYGHDHMASGEEYAKSIISSMIISGANGELYDQRVAEGRDPNYLKGQMLDFPSITSVEPRDNIRFSRTVEPGEYDLPRYDRRTIFDIAEDEQDAYIESENRIEQQRIASLQKALDDNYAFQIDNGDGRYIVVHPFTKARLYWEGRQAGREGIPAYQATRFDQYGAVGDTPFNTAEELEEELRGDYRNRTITKAEPKNSEYTQGLRFARIPQERKAVISMMPENIIIEDIDQLREEIIKARQDSGDSKKFFYLGMLSDKTAQRIRDTIEQIKGGKKERLIDSVLKEKNQYAIRIGISEVNHNQKEKLSLEDIVDYIMRVEATIDEFDKVSYTTYNNAHGLLLEKTFPDGTYRVVVLVSNQKYTLTVHNVNMRKKDYEAKKRSLPRRPDANAPDHTSETDEVSTSKNRITLEDDTVKRESRQVFDSYNDVPAEIASDRKFGFHAGDLGKAEYLGNMSGGGRSTGHFGTGTYFVKNLDALKGNGYKGRKVYAIDFSKYNLYKPTSEEQAKTLHDFLKEVNSGKTSNELSGTREFRTVQAMLHTTEDKMIEVLDNLERDYSDWYADSLSTQFMKAFGYEGVDVRHLEGLDNTTYGSVIYDLKGEDYETAHTVENRKGSRYSRRVDFTSPSGEKVTAYGAQNKLSSSSIENYARGLVNTYGTDMTIKDVSEHIGEFYERIRTAADGLDIWSEAKDIASEILDSSFHDTSEFKADYDNLKKDVKGTVINTQSITKDDIPSEYETVGEFIRKTRDVFSFSREGGLPVDVALMEISDRTGISTESTLETPLGLVINAVRGKLDLAKQNVPMFTGAEYTAELNVLTNDIIDNYYETPLAKKTGLDLWIDNMQKRQLQLKDELEKAKNEAKSYKERFKTTLDKNGKKSNQIGRLEKKVERLNNQISTLDESIKELKSARSKDVKQTRIDNKNLNKILDVATTFKQWGKGERNASEFADPVIKGFVNELGKIKYRSDISRTKARKIVANLKPWYTEANLGDYFSQEIADRIDYIAERKDNTKYPDSEELQYIADVMQGIKHLYQTYDQMTLDGKKVSIRETATREYGVLENSPYSETRIRRLNWLSGRTGYGVKTTVTNAINNIIEPRVVYQMLEGFNEDGMLSKLFKATTDAETGMNAMYINMTRSFDDFFKDNKGYKKHYQKDMITVAGKQMTIGEAISLYWTANREEAKATLMSNRIGSGIVWQNANGVTQRIQNVADVEALRDSIWKQFSDEDKQLARMVHEFYTVTATDIKREADERILGFTNIREGRDDYYPFVRDKNQIGKKFADAKSLMSDVTSAYNYSFNKDIKQNVTLALQLIPADVMWKDHARKMSMYSNMTEILQTWDKVLNCNLAVDENGKKTGQESLRGKLSEKWKDFSKYHSNFMQDVQNKGRGEANPFANFVRGAYATSALGFNPKVIVSQFASYPTALMYLDEKSMTEGLGMKTDFDKLDEYSPYAMARAYENGIVLSEGNITSTLGEIGNKTTAGISWMDRQTIGKLWNACQVYVRDHNGYAIGTDENYRARAELHEQICRRTQPNYTQTERSGMMRSGNEIVKSFTMFTSVPLKQLSRMVETMTKASMAQEAYKRDASSENKAKLDQAKHEAVMCQVSCLLANAMYVALATLVRFALPKKDEDKELSVARFAKDTWDVYMGLVPVWKDLYGYFFNGYEINNYFYSQVNDMLDTVKKLGDFKDDPYGTMMDFTSQALMFSGIPVRNFKNVIKGVMNRAGDLVGGSAAYEIAKRQKSIANTSNKKYFLQYAYNALYDGDTQSASYIIQDMRSRGYTEKEIETALKSIFAQHAYDAWNSSDQAELTKVLNAMSILGWNESAISSQLKTLMKKGLQEESDIKAFARKLARYQRTGSGNADQLRTEMNRLIRKYTGQGYQQSIIEEAIQAAM